METDNMNSSGLNIGIMTINGFDFHPNARFRQEAEKRGHRIMLIDPYGMGCVIEKDRHGIILPDHPNLPDLVMPRQGSPMGEYGFVLLRQFDALDIPLRNSIEGVTIARNQFITLQRLTLAGIPVPDTCFVTREDTFFRAVEKLGNYPVVVKQVDGMGGDGVTLLNNPDEAQAYLKSYFSPRKGVLLQAFIKPEDRMDVRLLVIGDNVAGAMALTPAPGKFKANIHQQGKARPFVPTREQATMAVAAARACCLDVAGVDILVTAGHGAKGAQVIEVNYSPGFRGLEEATGLNIAGSILDHVITRARAKQPEK